MIWTSTVTIVYASMFLDNLLLTVVVPIIPDYLFSRDNMEIIQFGFKTNKNITVEAGEEGGRVGALLSAKAMVQLIANPMVGHLARYTGYSIPLFFGSFCLLISSLLFAIGEGYSALLIARSLQGVASSCIGVAGMCVVACSDYESEEKRSRVMGVVLGSVALGVLLGYPTGGFLYSTFGKLAPFLFVATLTLINLEDSGRGYGNLLTEPVILLSAGAICLSSSAMAILEPCLPLWLMDKLKPKKWELGTVFIPDSIGYLVGTNCFGVIAYRLGRWRISIAAMILLGISAVMVPLARSVLGLAMPHFCLGLSVGVVDAALVPLLATVVDKTNAHYSSVYSIQQTAVSLAYALGPMIGGELVHKMGFPWLMRTIGLVNIIYSPLLILLTDKRMQQEEIDLKNCEPQINYRSMDTSSITTHYQQMHD